LIYSTKLSRLLGEARVDQSKANHYPCETLARFFFAAATAAAAATATATAQTRRNSISSVGWRANLAG